MSGEEGIVEQKSGGRRQETACERKETGDRRQHAENGRQETGDRRQHETKH
jgi:hypothetical protein